MAAVSAFFQKAGRPPYPPPPQNPPVFRQTLFQELTSSNRGGPAHGESIGQMLTSFATWSRSASLPPAALQALVFPT